MPEPVAPDRAPDRARALADERAWLAAYPALIGAPMLLSAFMALVSPLSLGPLTGLGGRVVLGALLVAAGVHLALGRRWAGRFLVGWLAVSGLLELLVARDLVMVGLNALLLVIFWRLIPAPGAPPARRPLRWLVPAAVVGAVDVLWPVVLGAVNPLVVAALPEVAPTVLRLDEGEWREANGGVRLVPRGDLLVVEGLPLVRGAEVAFVPGRDALLVGDAVLRGAPTAGTSPVIGAYDGLEYTRRFGRVRGRVVVARARARDQVLVSFEGLAVDGRRARASVVLRLPARPGAPALAPEAR
ncbi:MAG: hypothetical protein KF878_23590 [Planctomycetes bacterium]|nr:hypothetical protein [Planctomycetota bacterium]